MSNTTLRLNAHYATEYSRQAGLPQDYSFSAELPTVEAAREFVTLFPKSVKMFAATLYKADHTVGGWATTRGNLVSDGVNGGLNETGLKRYQAVLKAAAKLGLQIEYAIDAKNSYATREAFEQAIA